MTAILDSSVRIPKPLVTPADKMLYEVSAKYSNEIFKMYSEEEKETLFPVTAVERFRHLGIDDRRTVGRLLPESESLFEPRKGQREAVDRMYECLRDRDRPDQGLLIAGCGKGKTVMGTEVARLLRRPTCILVHKEYLGEQWVKAIELLAPHASVGFVRQDNCDTGHEKDFVIASTQSLTSSTRTYPEEFYNSFGVLELDEVHRYGADTWQRCLQMFPTKIRFGLTATDGRFDGLWPVIEAHLGRRIVELESDPMTFKVFTVPIQTEFDSDFFFQSWMDKVMQRSKLISYLADHVGRNKVIARNLVKAYKANRRVLLISDRKKQLKTLQELCGESDIPESAIGFFVGGKSKKARKEAIEKQFIFTTYQMSEEGLDIEKLDTLYLGTPRAHIVQTVGRILREFEGKNMPIVFDPIDVLIPETVGWAHSRVREYTGLGATIEGHFRSKG